MTKNILPAVLCALLLSSCSYETYSWPEQTAKVVQTGKLTAVAIEDNGDIYLLTERIGDYLFAVPNEEDKTNKQAHIERRHELVNSGILNMSSSNLNPTECKRCTKCQDCCDVDLEYPAEQSTQSTKLAVTFKNLYIGTRHIQIDNGTSVKLPQQKRQKMLSRYALTTPKQACLIKWKTKKGRFKSQLPELIKIGF